MTLQRKLALFLLAASLAPVVGVGFPILGWAQRELGRRASAEHLARARSGAASISADLAQVDATLSTVAESWRPDRLDEADRRGLLLVLSRQLPAVEASAIVDGEGTTRALLSTRGGAAEEGFLAAVRAAREGTGRGLSLHAYEEAGGGVRLAAVRAIPAADGGRWLVAVRLGTSVVQRRLDAAVPEDGAAYLASGTRLLVTSVRAEPLTEAARGELAERIDRKRAGALLGRSSLAAWAPLAAAPGWSVVVGVPAEVAYAPIVGLRHAALTACALVALGVLALSALLARRISARVARIDAAVRALGEGEVEVRLPEEGRDEIAAVSRTFNAMAEELGSARARLERWNDDLQREVDARTRELREAQAQLLEAQKLAAIGQLGAGAAHEINNPLTGILGNAQLLLEAMPRSNPDRESVEKIEALARRCRDITQKLIRFSQQRAEPDFRELDANRVVAEALALVDGHLRAGGIPLDVSLAEPSPRVKGDPGHLAQVVLNLLSNARTACAGRPGAGIRIATRRAGGDVEIVVSDGGKGIAPEHLPRIFEPFFTTKDQWSNVGLGLSVSYRIVAEHGGRIDVESRAGEGSTFTVRLPAASAAATAA
ncbi:ATP-binding protein [Anaeromyxobacter sp. Fw109-5]|uniref:ATP-binding protein n=1 Tax=Anaeromyxobacter sp. (strain Fw109-5) TaxID=404589 RepID=UPI0000ED8281|nr:ATP-binding protein [Anaeromyxobacter sp. Fw109-5]ABS26058.1 histidine kinase [Anaeromyxobacter sp. Fw109-5]